MRARDEGVGGERLRQAANQGLRVALLGRGIALGVAALWPLIFSTSAILVSVLIALSALAGLGYRRIVGSEYDHPIYRYVIFTADILLVGAIFAVLPLSVSEEVPQHFAFRAYGIHYFLPILGAAALALSPGLILWCGSVIVATWAATFSWITASMEHPLRWSDLGEPYSYRDLILHPDFVNSGGRIEECLAILILTALIAFAVHRARRVVALWIRSETGRQRITGLFGRFAPPEIVSQLAEDGANLEPTKRQATVLFTDIEGFTSLSETRTPDVVLALLNAYFERVGAIAAQRGGVIVNLHGDGLLIAFNAPADVPNHAAAALETATEVLTAIEAETFNGERIAVRVGIHTGEVVAGLAGSRERQTYTVYGDTVNVAARLEQLNKEHGTRLMISAETAKAAGGAGGLRDLGEVSVRGHAAGIRVFGGS
ncbi:adenylate/guanylate cyclase domain-containing protein [Thalassobaculum sp. OXR-137]|uniref:adenylate/guanylate cyclase domain-containing protein n=1 Tax=Thalassobaculum sp. OXR-137 TaxID=3100173 RepID=UPI002AC93376|nr:adenylate/guanylate cyclase domain-containing protein [Thalassobaculum sp. OXR-137]WPZ34215.1 adenylate/guanylate cyclase domain-containing protein [Thalassobaculum sp. OXR-137]